MEIPEKGLLNCTNISHKYISKHYPEFYSFLMGNYKDCNTLSEKLYLYYNGLDKRPCCAVCGTDVKFINFFRGFRKTCCKICRYNNTETKNKTKKTNIEKYGVPCGFQNESIKEKIKQTNLERYGIEYAIGSDIVREKIKQTNLERYGVENPQQNECIKEKTKQTNLKRYGAGSHLQNKIIRGKIKKTNLERYGIEYAIGSDIIKEKIKQTNIERYGVENIFKIENIQKSINNKFKENIIESHSDLIRYSRDNQWVCKCPHPECNKCFEKEYIIDCQNYHNRKNLNIEPCTKLLPIQSPHSTPELQIRNFLDSLNIEYITNDRSIITPKELDIYIPSRNIAVEFNGSYWHSNKDKYYHQNKTKACYSKSILLIHIYEYEWNINKESILSKLKDILDGKEVDGIVSVKDYDKYTLSEPVLIDCGPYKIWNEGKFIRK